MKQHIKTLPHHPKRVILISLFVAAIIGVYGYLRISDNRKNLSIDSPTYVQDAGDSSHPKSSNITLGFLATGRIKSVLVKSGDKVTKGQMLAELDAGNTSGALTQARAAYAIANANYEKVINGASGPTIELAKTAVNNATTNLNQISKQQDVLVGNAYVALLNSTPQAYPKDDTLSESAAPTVSGSYTLGKEGDIKIKLYNSSSPTGYSFTLSGLVEGTGNVSNITPQPLGNSGLYITFPDEAIENTEWIVSIPNTKAGDYIDNYNAYQAAREAKAQALTLAQSTLDQAKANLGVVAAVARPEDVDTARAQVASAKGAVEIAEAAYNNTIISAPEDGTVVSVAITPGQIAVPNMPAIIFINNTVNQ